ncbi:FixH family protein [Bacillaceae bacterium S4-13-58]
MEQADYSFCSYGNPVSLADVTFEMWKIGTDKHNYVDTEEVSEGMYELDYTFSESASYMIQIHVKSDVIHDHQEYEVNVD